MANQLKKKFIGNDQIDSTKILLENSTSFRSKKADGTTEVELLKIDGNNKVIIHKEGGAEEVGYKSQVDTVASDLASEITRATAAEAQALVDAKAYTDAQISAIPAVDLSSYETIANVDSKDAAKLLEAKAYADQVSMDAQTASQGYADSLFDALDQTVEQGLNASLLINGTRGMEGNLIMGDESGMMYKISGLGDGVSAHDAVNKGQLDAAISQEILDRQAADAALQTQITNVLSNVDGTALNSLAEIVTAFQEADSNLNGAITSLAASASSGLAQEVLDRQAGDSALQAELDQTQVDLSSEVTRATGAESALSGRIDILETYVATQNALVKVVEKIVITQAMIDAEYVDLAHIVSPIASSIVLIDRLILHPGASEDYVMPTVGGVTRLTFKNELVGSGNQKLQVGDNIYVRYSYSV